MQRRCSALRCLRACVVAVCLLTLNASYGADGATWPGFRGEQRDGHVAKLPKQLNKVELLWAHPLPSSGVGGVAANENFVVVSSRDAKDKQDLFICLDPVTGTELWRLSYPSN